MKLFDYQATLPYTIEAVFALTVDLERAPRWHGFFTDVQQLTPDPIGVGSRWQMIFNGGSFELEIVEYEPPRRVVFRGSTVMGMVPNFTIELQPVAAGTQIHYLLHPDVPALMRLPVALLGPPFGRRDLNRYFGELETLLAV